MLTIPISRLLLLLQFGPLHNVQVTCKCDSVTDLLRQLYVLSH